MFRADTATGFGVSAQPSGCDQPGSFFLIFVLSLPSEFIANDKPVLVYHEGRIFVPVLEFVPETAYGGFFETDADYTDPVTIELIEAGGWMVRPLISYGYDTQAHDLTTPAPSPPDGRHWLGTDDEGRDVLARLLYGVRISLLFGLVLTVFSTAIGVVVGCVQGYFGGAVDLIGQRFIEIWNGLPALYILIILASLVEPNFWWLMGIMLAFSWSGLVGVVRAEVLRSRAMDYVLAARALGVPTVRIMARHVFPNAMVATLTFVPFITSASITTLTSLDFLGFGLPPGAPSLGELLKQGKENLSAPWLGVTAFGSIALLLGLLVFIGEAVRDAFDPRKANLDGFRG